MIARSFARRLAVGVVLIAVAWLTATAGGHSLAAGAVAADEPCVGASCGVDADPEDAAYVGTGGLLLPADSFTGSSADRADAATCEGCQWALALMCRGDGPRPGLCSPAAQSCPANQVRYIVLLWRPADPQWQTVGLVCLSRAGPTTVADVADLLRDRVIEDVPRLRPSMQPAGRTLVQLPTLFASGQPAALGERQFDLVGFQIVLRGRATWAWTFGDGGSLDTTEPGGPWPDTSVSHVFAQPGSFSVTVTSTWRAWFTVDGLGPFAVGGAPVVQTAPPLGVEVLQARAELVAD
jgi:hypothetical protein